MMSIFNGIGEKNSKSVNWDVLLDSNNHYKLLYNLHNIESLISTGLTSQRVWTSSL
jgi:hypothetical protein